jgi:hypothetical protein
LAGGVTDVGESEQLTVPFGVVQVNPTAEVKLFKEVTRTVEVIANPTFTAPEEGVAPMLKSGAGLTVKI